MTTDANERLTMLSLRTRPSNTIMKSTRNPRPPQAQFSLPPGGGPQAKPVVSHQALLLSNSGYPLVISVISVIPTVPIASTSVP